MSTTYRTTVMRTLSAVALTLTLAAGLVACKNDDTETGSAGSGDVSTTEQNDADVSFASDMIQHHAQALSMVDLTLDRALDPEVQTLAEGIRDAQAPEIETMADWLTSWGEEVPTTVRDHANSDHDMGDMGDMGEMDGDMMDDTGSDMPGMMSADEMDSLGNAPEAEFQDMWLQKMIEHHEGAVEMAKTEQADGQFKDAVDLAGTIIDTQQQEVGMMKELLGS